jgi:translation initiation factor IF-3
MRISRKKRPEKILTPQHKKNHEIDYPEVLVIDEEGASLGIMKTTEALRITEERGLDLVEINPKSTPPAVKIVDYSEFKYQKEKEARKQRAHSHTSDIKGVRLSVRIGEHDLAIKREQSQKFLERGDKVKIELILRGREHAKLDIAYEIMRNFIASIEAIFPIRIEQEVQRQEHKLTAMVAKK